MSENLKNFMKKAIKNEEMKSKLVALRGDDTGVERIIELAGENGVALTKEDFKPSDNTEISLDELDKVAGGNGEDYGACLMCGSKNIIWGGEYICLDCGTEYSMPPKYYPHA